MQGQSAKRHERPREKPQAADRPERVSKEQSERAQRKPSRQRQKEGSTEGNALGPGPNQRLQADRRPRVVLLNVKRRGWAAAAEAWR